MALNRETLNFVLMGAKNTGKTVFLSTLYGSEVTITTTSKLTKDYLQGQWDYLNAGETPGATSARLIMLDLVYKSGEYNVPFRIDDYDGYFAETLSDDDPATQEDRNLLKENIKEAEGILLFFPYEDNPNINSIERFRYEINTFIALVREAFPQKNNLPIPVVIYVSKWDRSPYYKSVDENERVLEYIHNVEHYRVSKEMVENYFSNVKVIPFSSFGFSRNGNTPEKNKIEPYNLTRPLDFFLNYFFSVFTEKISTLQKENNIPKLFKSLFVWMHVVKFYEEGKFEKIYENVSKSYQDQLVSELSGAHTTEEFNEILEANTFFCENYEAVSFKHQIQAEYGRIKKEKRGENSKKITKIISISLVAILMISCSSLICFEFFQYKKRSYIVNKMKNVSNLLPYEQINLAEEYLSQFSLIANYLPGIEEERAEVESLKNGALAQARKKLIEKYESVKDIELTEQNIRLLEDLKQDASRYEELDIFDKISSLAQNFEERYQEKQRKIKAKEEVVAAGKRLLDDQNANLGEVSDAIQCLQEYNGDEEICLLNKLKLKRDELAREEKIDNIKGELKRFSDSEITQLDILNVVQGNWDDS